MGFAATEAAIEVTAGVYRWEQCGARSSTYDGAHDERPGTNAAAEDEFPAED